MQFYSLLCENKVKDPLSDSIETPQFIGEK